MSTTQSDLSALGTEAHAAAVQLREAREAFELLYERRPRAALVEIDRAAAALRQAEKRNSEAQYQLALAHRGRCGTCRPRRASEAAA
jgi:hypothetical protein